MTRNRFPPSYSDWTGEQGSLPTSLRLTTAAIIFNEKHQILLEKRSDNGFWGLPGGAMEIGESIESALRREVVEETGLVVIIERLIGIYSDPRNFTIARYPDGNISQNVNFLFICKKISGTLEKSAESLSLGFHNLNNLPEPLLPGHLLRIRDALSNNDNPIIG